MDTDERPHAWRLLGRAMLLRCPVCGVGHLFRGMHPAAHCTHCGFRFEREDGYWSNAATLNFMITGTVSTLLIAPLALLSAWSIPALLVAALALAVGLALVCFRHIKALWLAADLIIRPPSPVERLSGYLHTVRQPAEAVADKHRE